VCSWSRNSLRSCRSPFSQARVREEVQLPCRAGERPHDAYGVSLRDVGSRWAAEEHEPAPIADADIDRGYSDPRAETLTELIIELEAEGRKERRLRRLEQQANLESGHPQDAG
jgi:hypothetical protein